VSSEGFNLLDTRQPPISAGQLDAARGLLKAYRFLAFLTGVVLISGCVLLVVKYGTDADVEPTTGIVWVAHGWLFLIYVVVTAMLGFRLRWPLLRYGLVMLAGTIPTMSFVAEHFVTRAIRPAQAVPAAD
jgi:integral membrane protein